MLTDTDWGTNSTVLLERAVANARKAVASHGHEPFTSGIRTWREVEVRCGTLHQPYVADPKCRGLLWQRLPSKPASGRQLTDDVAPNASKLAMELAKEPELSGLIHGNHEARAIAFTRETWEDVCKRAVRSDCEHANCDTLSDKRYISWCTASPLTCCVIARLLACAGL